MRYCVICATNINRKWFDNEHDAVEHAKDMIQNDARWDAQKAKTLMVIAGTKYVRLASPLIEVVDID